MFDLLFASSLDVMEILTTTVFPLTRELLFQGGVGAALVLMLTMVFPTEEPVGRRS